MRYLNETQVLFIHARLVEETGGEHGVRDLAMLESAIARPRATFEGKDLYPDIFTKTAVLMDSLVNNHPFVDGNKRTGIAAAALFLRPNGYRLVVENLGLERFTFQVAQSQLEVGQMAEWFQAYSQME